MNSCHLIYPALGQLTPTSNLKKNKSVGERLTAACGAIVKANYQWGISPTKSASTMSLFLSARPVCVNQH